MDMLRLVAAACCDMAELQHSVVNYAIDQYRKSLGACINAAGGHSEHLL